MIMRMERMKIERKNKSDRIGAFERERDLFF